MIFCAILGFVIVYNLLYSGRTLGYIVQKLIVWFSSSWPPGWELKIRSLGVYFLGGQLIIHGIEIRSKELTLLILQCNISLFWWESDVRDRKTVQPKRDPNGVLGARPSRIPSPAASVALSS